MLVFKSAPSQAIIPAHEKIFENIFSCFQGRIQEGGGGGPGGQDPPFWGTPKLHKEGKKRCTRKRHILVLNSYPDPPFQDPVSAPAVFYLKLEIRHLKYQYNSVDVEMPSLSCIECAVYLFSCIVQSKFDTFWVCICTVIANHFVELSNIIHISLCS